MLNPALDTDAWITLSYSPNPFNTFNDNLDGSEIKGFLDSIKKYKNTNIKFDDDDFPFPKNKKPKETDLSGKKIKSISRQKFLGLKQHLKDNVVGQDEAVDVIVNALKRSQAGLSDSDRPLGVFLFAGSSGVGKTHLANTLHKYLFGTDYPMVRIDCGEFQHKHENQKLIGSPPGYIGHDEGGQLVNIVKQHPSTVVLLDEVEKAHPDLWNTFLRVFDDGVLTDGKGELVDFTKAIIIMTTNLGNDKTTDHLLGSGTGFANSIHYKTKTKVIPERSILERNTNDAIKKHFKPEFLNRIDKVILFNYLSESDSQKIAKLEMQIVNDKLYKKGFKLKYTDKAIQALIEKGIDSVKGARALAQVRRDQIELKIADAIMDSQLPKGTTFVIDYKDEDFNFKLQKPIKKASVEKKA
jgi:ATP-dependent Clp protease ATP-binding subunit ClpA